MAVEYDDRDYLDHSKGINQHKHDLILDDDELLDARNFYSEGGALYKRRGNRQLGQAFSANLKTVFPYKNRDGASYLLGVDTGGAFKALLAPPKKIFTIDETTAAGSVNFESGKEYRWAITYVDFDLRESPFSEIIAQTASADFEEMTLENIPVGPPNVFYKKIYRTLGDGGVFYGATTTRIANGTTSYTDSRDDATVGALTARQASSIYSSDDWNNVRDYHGQNVTFDTTNTTEFVMHLDWAIAYNGVDRYKWSAPQRLGTIELISDVSVSNRYVAYIEESTYVESHYSPGKHVYAITESTFARTATLVLNVYYTSNSNSWGGPERSVILMRQPTATVGDVLYSAGDAVPFGIPAPKFRVGTPDVADSGGGAGPDGTHTYKMTYVNMNGSQSADSGQSDSVTLTDNIVTIGGTTAIPAVPTTPINKKIGSITITADSPDTDYATFTLSSSTWLETFGDTEDDDGEELFISGFSKAGNNGVFRVSSVDTTPTTTVFVIYNTGAVNETIDATEVTINKVLRVTAAKFYRTEGTGAPPWKETFFNGSYLTGSIDGQVGATIITAEKHAGNVATYSTNSSDGWVITPKIGETIIVAGFTNAGNNGDFVVTAANNTSITVKNTNPAVDENDTITNGVTVGLYTYGYHKYVDGKDEALAEEFSTSDAVTDTLLRSDIYTTTKPQNDDPPRFRHAVSLNSRLITGLLDYSEDVNIQKSGALYFAIHNFEEVEGQNFLNSQPLGSGTDSTEVRGIKDTQDHVEICTDRITYRVSNTDNIDTGDPVIEKLGNVGCLDGRSMQTADMADGQQMVVFMGTNGPYEIRQNGLVLPLGATPDKPVHRLQRLFSEVLTGEAGQNQNNIDSVLHTDDERYIVNLKKDSATVQDIAVVYDFKEDAFWIWSGFDAGCMCYWEGKLVHGNLTKCYFEQRKSRTTDYSDDGSAIEAYIETKYYTQGRASWVKKWDEVTLYASKLGVNQLISIGGEAEYGTTRTNIGLGETTVPFGYTDRSFAVNSNVYSVTKQTGNMYRLTYVSGGTAPEFVTNGAGVGDRVRIIDSSPFLNENQGDWPITVIAETYFEVENEWGFPEASVTMTADNQIIIYYADGTESDGLDTMFVNVTMGTDREPKRTAIAPGSARMMRLRFESFLNSQEVAIAGWTIKFGGLPNKGIDR